MPDPAAILALADDAGRLTLRVTPGAAQDAIALPTQMPAAAAAAGGSGERALLLVRVTAPPDGGKANDAVLKLLGQALGIAPSMITLLSGETARIKRVALPLPRAPGTRGTRGTRGTLGTRARPASPRHVDRLRPGP